jgi:hypothetical protein
MSRIITFTVSFEDPEWLSSEMECDELMQQFEDLIAKRGYYLDDSSHDFPIDN